MGRFDFQMDPEFARLIERLENVDEIAPKMLDAGIVIMESTLKAKLSSHVKSGDLLNSIKSVKAKKNKYGWYSYVFPKGKDKKGVRNAEKLVYMEYGTKNQAPKPVFQNALNESKQGVFDKMQQVFEEEVNGR